MEGSGICSACFLRKRGAAGEASAWRKRAEPSPSSLRDATSPEGGGLFVLTGRCIKAPPERKDFPRPGEDVAQRQKGESGRDQRERTERVRRPLGGAGERSDDWGSFPRHPAL